MGWVTSWIGWIAKSGWTAGSDTQDRHARNPVLSEPLREISNPTPDGKGGILSQNRDDLKESRGSWREKLRGFKPTGKEQGRESRDESGPLLVPEAARVVSERRHHRLSTLVDHLILSRRKIGGVALGAKSCKTFRSDTELSDCLGSFLKFVQKRTLHLVANGEIDGAMVVYSNDWFLQDVQHRHGSQILAAVMVRSPSFSRFGSRKLSRFHRCLKVLLQFAPPRSPRAMPAVVSEGFAAQLNLLNQPLMAAFILILRVTYMRPSERASGVAKERSGPAADATFPLLVGRDRSIRN